MSLHGESSTTLSLSPDFSDRLPDGCGTGEVAFGGADVPMTVAHATASGASQEGQTVSSLHIGPREAHTALSMRQTALASAHVQERSSASMHSMGSSYVFLSTGIAPLAGSCLDARNLYSSEVVYQIESCFPRNMYQESLKFPASVLTFPPIWLRFQPISHHPTIRSDPLALSSRHNF